MKKATQITQSNGLERAHFVELILCSVVDHKKFIYRTCHLFYSGTDMMFNKRLKNMPKKKQIVISGVKSISEKNSWQIDIQNYDSTNISPMGLYQNRTCKGICRNFAASNISAHGGRYANGQMRCTTCMIFLTEKGVIASESGKKLCKCCHMAVRVKPRQGKGKRAYLEKIQNQMPNNLETIDSVDENDVEIVEEEYTKKSTPVFQESANQKTYYDLHNFIENEIQLQANYQLVMLKYLISNKEADKGQIAESIAYFNNKDTSTLDEVKKYLHIPVYDVLVKQEFVKENIKPNGRKVYELNVNLNQYQQIELNEILEKKIKKWNNEHAIPENQFDSIGVDWSEHGDLLMEPNVWIWPVTEENWKIVQQKNIWGSKIPAKQIQNKLLKDDIIIFYIIGAKEFRGIYRISGRWFDSTDKVWADEIRSNEIIYNSRLNLEPIILGIAKIENLNNLLIFEGKDQNLLNLTLKGIAGYPANNAKPIPPSEFETIMTLMKNNPLPVVEVSEIPNNQVSIIEPQQFSESEKSYTPEHSENHKVFEMTQQGLEIQEFYPIKEEIIRIGQRLTNDDLSKKFGVGNMGGIRYSKKNNVIVLCDTNFSAYNNQLDSDIGTIFFSGEEQSGDQNLSGGNSLLANSNNISVFYFVEVQQEPGMKKRGTLDNIYKLIGKVRYLKHTIKTENDISGKPRQVIKFLLEIEK